MAKGEFGMLHLCAGGRAMIVSFDKSTSLERGVRKKKPEMIRGGGLPKNASQREGNHHSPPSI